MKKTTELNLNFNQIKLNAVYVIFHLAIFW